MKNNKELNRLYKVGFIILCLIIISMGLFYYNILNKNNIKSYPQASRGILDLTGISSFNNGNVPLSGQWEFYYQQFAGPLDLPLQNIEYIHAPSTWNHYVYEDKKIGGDAYATYRLSILGLSAHKVYGIDIPDMACAYHLFIDGKLISKNGTPGTNAHDEKPLWKPHIAYFSPQSSVTEVVIHISNFHHVEGGMWEPLYIGEPNKILEENNYDILKSYFLIGAILLLGLDHSILYILLKNNKSGLYLCLLCISTVIRELSTGNTILPIQILFPNISFFLIVRMEFIAIPLGIIFYISFLNSLFTDLFNKKYFLILNTLSSIYVLMVLFTPLKIFRGMLWYIELTVLLTFLYVICTFVIAVKRRVYGSSLVLVATIILLITTWVDSRVIGPTYLQAIGMLLFLIIQSFMMSLRIVYAFENSEKKSAIEISFLQAQIVPHFLYNVINTLHYYISQNPIEAKKILEELSSYLRGKFRISQYDQLRLIQLEEEISMIRSYLTLEKKLLDNQLEIEMNLQPESLSVKIPPLILQPVVENAIIHGIDKNAKHQKIAISTCIEDHNLAILIEDNGKGIPQHMLSRILNGKYKSSVGLKNVAQRLEQYYHSELEINSEVSKGTQVIINIPMLHTKGDANVKSFFN